MTLIRVFIRLIENFGDKIDNDSMSTKIRSKQWLILMKIFISISTTQQHEHPWWNIISQNLMNIYDRLEMGTRLLILSQWQTLKISAIKKIV